MFDYTFRIVSIGGALLGLLSGVLGSLVVIRKQSLIGDTISHAALPGIGIAFLIAGRSLPALLVGAGVSSLVGIGFVYLIQTTTRIKADAAMGIVLSGWFAGGLGVLSFIQKQQNSSGAGLSGFIFGQAAAIVSSDVLLLLALSIVVLLVLALAWKEFKIISFDPEFARSVGVPVQAFNALFMLMVVSSVVIGLQLAGVVLILGLVIAPGIAARQWTRSLGGMATLAGGIGAVSGALGAVISALNTNIPTGPTIVVVVSAFVLLSVLFAPERGIATALLRRHRNKNQHQNKAVKK